ncbi:MAG: DUF2877 domain-containing protein [Nocardioides sp.]|uniref:DUF2877 domain-containing protein n=1 Tax=Nocardioides sp. TaxID=35761 RepID=UPI0039E6D566
MAHRVDVPAAASPWVRDLMAGPERPARVVHVGLEALYVAVRTPRGERCVGVLAARAHGVPCGLRTRLPGFAPGLAAGDPAVVGDGALRAGEYVVRITRVIGVGVPRFDGDGVALVALIGAAPGVAAVRAEVGGMRPEVDDWRLIVGRGSGLTPAGDDLLCGYLAARRAVGAPVVDELAPDLLARTTTLSATLLERAAAGDVLDEFAALIRAANTTRTTSAHAVPAALEALLGIGHTSGAALALGLASGLALAVGPAPGVLSAAAAAGSAHRADMAQMTRTEGTRR